jgi:hypothetical protein
LHPSNQFLSGLNAADISRIQRNLLGVICSGPPDSDDSPTVRAKATEEPKLRSNDNASDQLLRQLASYPGEAVAPGDTTSNARDCRRKRSGSARYGRRRTTGSDRFNGRRGAESEGGRPPLRGRPGGAPNPESCGAGKKRRGEAEIERRSPTGQSGLMQSRRCCRENFLAVNNTKGQ